MQQKKNILYYLGNLLIGLSSCGFIFIFYPVIAMYLFPPAIDLQPSGEFVITIPKINAQAPVIANVDAWSQEGYKQALTKGVGHAKGTSLPNEKGTVFLFAHSSAYPWELTRMNTAFFRLGELQVNDIITLSYFGKKYRYKVYDKKEVSPYESELITKATKNQLILQTCTPIGTAWRRLLVFALPIK